MTANPKHVLCISLNYLSCNVSLVHTFKAKTWVRLAGTWGTKFKKVLTRRVGKCPLLTLNLCSPENECLLPLLNSFLETKFAHYTIHPFQVHSSGALIIFTGLCNQQPTLEHSHQPPAKTHAHYQSLLMAPPYSQGLGHHYSTFHLCRFAYSRHFI